MSDKLGISGRIARYFLCSAMTPLITILALLLGLFAIIITPKEEEPQIDVTFADVYIPFPGASAKEVESVVTTPAEQVISEVTGLDKLYSFSRPDGALIVAVFKVGVTRNDAIVRLYNQLYSNKDWLPQGLGVGEPIIKPKGIEDVPIVTLTLTDPSASLTNNGLTEVAHGLETELKRIKGTRDIYTVGAHPTIVDVRLDPVKMNAFGITIDALNQQLTGQTARSTTLRLTRMDQTLPLQIGQPIRTADEIEQIVVGVHHSVPVYLSDVAQVSLGVGIATQNVWSVPAKANGSSVVVGRDPLPAVTIAIAKQNGINAVDVANAVSQRIQTLRNTLIPPNVQVDITRNYGATAQEKSNTLLGKLVFATAAVVLLVLIAMGWRESIIVAGAIIVTLFITLFASWVWGFTLNRVSLFALIFSIGILVDDAIVVVENIHRHRLQSDAPLKNIIPIAVDEVGGPTILATLTVIAALLPMAFVSGLMGPYMSPIPINASMGMILSLLVAFVITPWLALRLSSKIVHRIKDGHDDASASRLLHLFTKLLTPFVQGPKQRQHRWGLAACIGLLIVGSLLLPVYQAVVLKMLPFDNKSEFQVVLDMPEGTSLEETQRILFEMGRALGQVPEVHDYQIYVGTAAPINFNGLVRHYFMRNQFQQGDIQVNLVGKHERDRSSHEIASSVRPTLVTIARHYGGKVKVVEVPPGPPVWSPILAEVYAPSDSARIAAARMLRERLNQTPDIVDVDIYLPETHQKWQLLIDRQKSAQWGISYQTIIDTLDTAMGGKAVSYLHSESSKYPVPVRVELKEEAKLTADSLLTLQVPSANGRQYALSDLVTVRQQTMEPDLVHKNMVPTIMVAADMSGSLDSPLYGMVRISQEIDSSKHVEQYWINQPDGLNGVQIRWDGEWTITYETFRDMGIAYAVGMVLIYLLVVAQFKSYLVPLIIMAPIPLTIIGVMPGHALLHAQFTATSMIGMIALAGIIVRNSILLVDFTRLETQRGVDLATAVVHAAAIRAKPIVLTGLAAMMGALFILDDPIFNGLAIALLFGIAVSTILTLVVIPILYYAVMHKRVA